MPTVLDDLRLVLPVSQKPRRGAGYQSVSSQFGLLSVVGDELTISFREPAEVGTDSEVESEDDDDDGLPPLEPCTADDNDNDNGPPTLVSRSSSEGPGFSEGASEIAPSEAADVDNETGPAADDFPDAPPQQTQAAAVAEYSQPPDPAAVGTIQGEEVETAGA